MTTRRAKAFCSYIKMGVCLFVGGCSSVLAADYEIWVHKSVNGKWVKQDDRTLRTSDYAKGKAYVQSVNSVSGWTATSNLPATKPDTAQEYVDRGLAFARNGEYDKAAIQYAAALLIDSKLALALDRSAWLAATCPDSKYRNGKRAVEFALLACELGEWDTNYISTLAAAYAEAGDFESAMKWQTVVVGQSYSDKKATVLAEHHLALYQEKKPNRQYPISTGLQNRLELPIVPSSSVVNDSP